MIKNCSIVCTQNQNVLNFLLQYVLKQIGVDWLGSPDAPLEGFSWRGGSERDTTGILMWSEVFLTEFDTGEKVRQRI